MKDLRSQFLDWLDEQDAEATFRGSDATGCAVYRFLRESGLPVSFCGVLGWYDHDRIRHPFPDAMTDIICAATALGETTFGALRSRLLEQAA